MAELIIAVRGGEASKQRCAQFMTAHARAALTRAMLGDMLDAVKGAAGVDAVWVVTPTAELAQLAIEQDAQAILESASQGMAEAFEAARARIAGRDPDILTILLPGDLPLLDPAELESAIAVWRPGRAGLVEAQADGGTGALLLAAGAPFAFSYGRGSFARHWEAARAGGLTPYRIDAPDLAFDLDRPADVDAFLARGHEGRTRQLLLDMQDAEGGTGRA